MKDHKLLGLFLECPEIVPALVIRCFVLRPSLVTGPGVSAPVKTPAASPLGGGCPSSAAGGAGAAGGGASAVGSNCDGQVTPHRIEVSGGVAKAHQVAGHRS